MAASGAPDLCGAVTGVASGPRLERGRVVIVAGEASDASAGLAIRGIDLGALHAGRRLRVGKAAVIQVTRRDARGSWLARVLRDGGVAVGDAVSTDAAFDVPRFAVLTISDRAAAGVRDDESGALAAMLLGVALGGGLVAKDVLADEAPAIEARLIELCDQFACDLIVTTGGTGLSPRDVTPEATLAVIDREVPGIAEALRAGGLKKTPHAMLSRGVCGQRGGTLIVNLSGSPRAVEEQLEILRPVLPHILTTASGVPQDCGELAHNDAG